MTWISNRLSGTYENANEVWIQPSRDPDGTDAFMARCRKDNAQTLAAASDVTEMRIPLKKNSVYSFSYDVMYSTTGIVLVGAQFAINYSDTALTLTYGITMVTIGNAVVSDATATPNTFIGGGTTVAAGGPRTARLFGGIKTSSSVGGDLILRAQPTGILGGGVRIEVNSCGKAEEQ